MLETNEISLTYLVGGECLVRPGKYTSADVYVKNNWKKDEIFRVNKPSETLVEPVYSGARCVVKLSQSFIDEAMSAPKRPSSLPMNIWLHTNAGKLAQNWKKFSIAEKLDIAINNYVQSRGGHSPSYEVH